MLYIHGGGLLVGDLDSEDLTCRRVCVGVGVGVVSVAYRLAPDEGVWPVQGDDVWRVVKGVVEGEVDVELGIEAGERKVRDGAEKVKKRKVVIMGSSSGSQLAACASIRAVREGWEKKVVGVVLRCPVTCYGGSAVSGEGKEEDWLPPWARGMHQSRKAEFENALLRLEGMRQSHGVSIPLPSPPALNSSHCSSSSIPLLKLPRSIKKNPLLTPHNTLRRLRRPPRPPHLSPRLPHLGLRDRHAWSTPRAAFRAGVR